MQKLRPRSVEKPWERTRLPHIFTKDDERRIGEIWFESLTGEDLPLLVKYIFTSERLSIQVHPDDEQAIAKACPAGKRKSGIFSIVNRVRC